MINHHLSKHYINFFIEFFEIHKSLVFCSKAKTKNRIFIKSNIFYLFSDSIIRGYALKIKLNEKKSPEIKVLKKI